MNKDYIRERIVPILATFKQDNPGILYIQDRTQSRSTGQTVDKPCTVGIVPVEWPPCCANLNPIENVWNSMKNFLLYNFSELYQIIKIPTARACELSKIA